MKLIQGGGEASPKREVPLKIIKGGKGMINLTNKIFRDNTFKTAFIKLYQSEMNHKAYYTVKRVMDMFELKGKEVYDTDQLIKKKYLTQETVQEEGKPDYVKNIWLDEKAAEEEFKALYESPFDIEVSKMFAVDVEHLRFSPSEWEALSPLIHDVSNVATS